VWVGRYLKEHSKPIAIVDPHGCNAALHSTFSARQSVIQLNRVFTPLLAALEGLARNGLVRPHQLQLLFVTTDLDVALDHIQHAISETSEGKGKFAEQ
jgi:hypothetical protein